MPESPTSRSLAECRKRGWTAYVVEKWIPKTRRKLDAFGFGDILVLDGQPGSLLIQATSGDNHAARRTKILAEPRAHLWLAAGNRIAVWSWSKRGARGKRKLWTLREESIGTMSPSFASAPADRRDEATMNQ